MSTGKGCVGVSAKNFGEYVVSVTCLYVCVCVRGWRIRHIPSKYGGYGNTTRDTCTPSCTIEAMTYFGGDFGSNFNFAGVDLVGLTFALWVAL